MSATPNASSLFDYNALGSGAEVRSEILQCGTNHFNAFEATCGEKSEKAEGKETEAKSGEKKAEVKLILKNRKQKQPLLILQPQKQVQLKKKQLQKQKQKKENVGKENAELSNCK